jgi:hypothetical protein
VTPTGAAVDGQGDVYVTGLYNGTVTFGATTLTGPTAAGTENMFLVKYDGGGHVLFAKSYGSATGNYTNPALAVDAAGNAYLGGSFSGTLDMGGSATPVVAIAVDAFASKISSTGQTLWTERFGYDAGPYAVLSIALGSDGNPIVAGSATGTINLGGNAWPAPSSGAQPFVAKLSSTDGSIVWSNATGGNVNSTQDIFVATDSAGRVFVAARVESGGGAWGVESASGAGNFATMRAGFRPDGSTMWGQFDYGGFPVAAAVDSAGRFVVVENAYNAVTVGGSSTTFGNSASGSASLALLFSPIDGTLLSGLNVANTAPLAATVDANGNTLLTGTYWPQSSPIPVGGLTLPGGGGANQPLFLAGFDGASQAVGVSTLGASNNAQPSAIAVDPGSANIFVAASLGTGFTSSVGQIQPGAFVGLFGPDLCNDGAGPLGPSTGNPNNHGDLAPDGGSPYTPEAGSPAPCPTSSATAVNGAACPIAMGCTYGGTCCNCAPMACNGQPTTWTCDILLNTSNCPTSAPPPGAACTLQGIQCNYCAPGGRLFAYCTSGGWETGYADLVCQ